MNATDPFETIVRDHYEPLFRFAMSLTRSEPDARDLTQQTFYVWATKGYQLRDFSKVKPWLFTTLHRAFLVGRRREARYPHLDLEEVSEQLPAPSAALGDQADSTQVITALAKVEAIYQAAVSLFYLDNCSYQDIAAVLEVPIGTVKSRIARGIAQLREILLSASSVVSFRNEDRTVSVAGVDGLAARPEDADPVSRFGLDLAAGALECASSAWDVSSSPLRELSALV